VCFSLSLIKCLIENTYTVQILLSKGFEFYCNYVLDIQSRVTSFISFFVKKKWPPEEVFGLVWKVSGLCFSYTFIISSKTDCLAKIMVLVLLYNTITFCCGLVMKMSTCAMGSFKGYCVTLMYALALPCDLLHWISSCTFLVPMWSLKRSF
jgi:hypothetical protein